MYHLENSSKYREKMKNHLLTRGKSNGLQEYGLEYEFTDSHPRVSSNVIEKDSGNPLHSINIRLMEEPVSCSNYNNLLQIESNKTPSESVIYTKIIEPIETYHANRPPPLQLDFSLRVKTDPSILAEEEQGESEYDSIESDKLSISSCLSMSSIEDSATDDSNDNIEKEVISPSSSSSLNYDISPLRHVTLLLQRLTSPNCKNSKFNNLSTRQVTLPPKNYEEEIQHIAQYHEMLINFYQREAEMHPKVISKQHAREAKIIQNHTIWTRKLLPNWENVRHGTLVHHLVGQGIPSCVRGKLWVLLIENELKITKQLFDSYLLQVTKIEKSAKQLSLSLSSSSLNSLSDFSRKVETIQLIQKDLLRTFPALGFYQAGGSHHVQLKRVLEVYGCYKPEIGYIQGMSYIAAILLLYMDEFSAFTCMANLLNRNIQMAFYKLDAEMEYQVQKFNQIFKRLIPNLYNAFVGIGLSTEMFLLDWILTIFSKSLPLDAVARIWDIYLLEGEDYLFKVTLGILYLLKDHLMDSSNDLVKCKKILSQIPEQYIDEEKLFDIIFHLKIR